MHRFGNHAGSFCNQSIIKTLHHSFDCLRQYFVRWQMASITRLLCYSNRRSAKSIIVFLSLLYFKCQLMFYVIDAKFSLKRILISLILVNYVTQGHLLSSIYWNKMLTLILIIGLNGWFDFRFFEWIDNFNVWDCESTCSLIFVLVKSND